MVDPAPWRHVRRSARLGGGVCALICMQCLGAFNDNVYKTVVSLMAADAGLAGGAILLSVSSIAFVAPYVLFSGYAGHAADRFDKRSVLIASKAVEVLITMLAFAALNLGSVELLIVLLFLLSTQATFFSPAKYGILPELLAPSALPLANGLMEMSRYVAVILGTAAGGIVLSMWRGKPGWIGALLMAVAVAGLLASLLVGRTKRVGGVRPFRINPWREIAEGLRRVRGKNALAPAVAGIAILEFLSALVMLDMILLGKSQMNLDDLHIGMLGAVVGLGAGAGSLAAAALSRGRIEPALALAGYAGIGVLLPVLAAASVAYVPTAIVFLGLGFFAGMIIVPLNALMQHASRSDEKGRLIATSNFLGMSGIVAASVLLWLLHDVCGLAPAAILVLAGLLSLSVALYAAHRRDCRTRALALRLAFRPSFCRSGRRPAA